MRSNDRSRPSRLRGAIGKSLRTIHSLNPAGRLWNRWLFVLSLCTILSFQAAKATFAQERSDGIQQQNAVLTGQIPEAAVAATVGAGNSPWERLPGAARDIAVSSGRSVWVVGTNPMGSGYATYQLTSSGMDWKSRNGSATSIAAGPESEVWTVDSRNMIRRWDDSSEEWNQVDGSARDVGVGADGSVWIVGTKAYPVGNAIYRRQGEDWQEVGGATASRIAVGPNGNAWVIDAVGRLFEYRGERRPWREHKMDSKDVIDIGVGANGEVWVIVGPVAEGGGQLLRYDGVEWRKHPGQATRIAVDRYGEPWVTNAGQSIYRSTCSAAGRGPSNRPTFVGLRCLKQLRTGVWSHPGGSKQLKYANLAWAEGSNPWGMREIYASPTGAALSV